MEADAGCFGSDTDVEPLDVLERPRRGIISVTDFERMDRREPARGIGPTARRAGWAAQEPGAATGPR